MYVVDFKKSGHDLLLDLVNFDNQNNPDWVPIQPEEIIFIEVHAQPEGSEKNTMAVMQTQKEGFDVREVSIYYDRIDVAFLFSAVGCFVQELGVDEAGEGGFLANAKFFDEINRKYGLNFTDTDFTIYRDGERYVIKSKIDSLAYISQTDVNVIPSLATRVAKTALDGFTMVSYKDKWVLSYNEAYPVGAVYETASRFDNPNHTVGGVWEEMPVVNLTPEQAFYYNHPLLYVISLQVPPTNPEGGEYVFLNLGQDSTYNEGIATASEEGWVIDHPASPYVGETVPFGPSDGYVLIARKEGSVNTGQPYYKWNRVE